MMPWTVKKNGRELGNAAAAAAICGGIRWETYQWYVRTGKPEGNPPPGHVETDNTFGYRLYPLKEVRAWHKARKGRGNWGGIGARARHRDDESAAAADDADAETADILADADTMAALSEARAE